MIRWGGVVFALVGCAVAAAGADLRRNVLFISIDDLRPQLGTYGDPLARTPHLDRLASRGTRFDRAYCQQALCAPSRASVLTGLRPDSTGIHGLNTPVRALLPDVRTLPQHFREAGYQTVSLGKVYHHANDDNGVGWSRPAWQPPVSWFRYGDPASAPTEDGGRPRSWEAPDVPDEFYADGQIAREAVRELSRLADAGQPFFLAVGFIRPHLPFFAPKRYWDLHDRAALPRPGRQDWPRGTPLYDTTDSRELRNYRDIPDSGPINAELAHTLVHGYYACVSYIDAQVGRVLAALEQEGLGGDTIVVVWGDHGYKLGEYGAWAKHTNHELDARVPLIVSLPGAQPVRRRVGAPVELVDLYPTLSEACGLDVPAHCEGRSFLRLLLSDAPTSERRALTQYPHGPDIMGYSVTDGRWRYTEWIERPTQHVLARELYDHRDGPVVEVNLAGDPGLAETQVRLAEELGAWRRRAAHTR